MHHAIFTGSRNWAREDLAFLRLSSLQQKQGPRGGLFVHVGDCPSGLDVMVRKHCKLLGMVLDRDYRVYYADWSKYGKGAGPVRNRAMVDQSLLDSGNDVSAMSGHAFPTVESRGTLDCIYYLESKKIKVYKVEA